MSVTLTRAQKLYLIYRHTPRDYRSLTNGSRCILVLREGQGTCLVPLECLTDEEIERKLPYAMKRDGLT